MALVHRLIRFLTFVLGVVTGVIATLFATGNQNTIPISIWSYTFHVQVYLLALVPLGAGLAVGWLYTVPARTAEFAGHWRSWRALRAMEKENTQLRKSLDQVLDLPADTAVKLPAREVAKLPAAKIERLEAVPVVVPQSEAAVPDPTLRRVPARKAVKPAATATKADTPAVRRRPRLAATSRPATNPA